MSTNSSNVAAVRKLTEDDRRLTVTQISQELQISYVSVQSIIKNELQYRKITARWVPRLLSDEQKNACVQICETLLAHYRNENDAFLNRIVTVDESWCHHYTPESNRASKEWRRKDEECPVKAKTQPSAGKVMATVFWDYKGVLHINFLHD
jgi:histone-lysine N-methyltransferase SETMAR